MPLKQMCCATSWSQTRAGGVPLKRVKVWASVIEKTGINRQKEVRSTIPNVRKSVKLPKQKSFEDRVTTLLK